MQWGLLDISESGNLNLNKYINNQGINSPKAVASVFTARSVDAVVSYFRL